MKQIKTIMAAFFVLCTVVSCKKNNEDVTPVVTGPKLSKIELAARNYVQTFSYNGNGRLVAVSDASFTHKYNYDNSPFGYEVFNSAGVKEFDIANTVFASGKLTKFDYRGYNSNGVINSNETNSVQYDANGYQTNVTSVDATYTFTISGGNTTGYTHARTNGTNTFTIEYYTDKPNKLNVNLLENWCQNQFLCDMEINGKRNTNLMKKVTTVYSSGSTQVLEYDYVLNADGLPTQITQKSTVNGGTATVSLFNLSYQ